MGTLTLPTSGIIYLDASAFIYSLERIEPYRTLLEPMWRHAQEGNLLIVSSELVVLETLVKPLRDNDPIAQNLFKSLFDASDVNLIPATREIWVDAATLRANTGLKTPDALHAATAIHAECSLFITNDDDFRRVEDLPILILDDYT